MVGSCCAVARGALPLPEQVDPAMKRGRSSFGKNPFVAYTDIQYYTVLSLRTWT